MRTGLTDPYLLCLTSPPPPLSPLPVLPGPRIHSQCTAIHAPPVLHVLPTLYILHVNVYCPYCLHTYCTYCLYRRDCLVPTRVAALEGRAVVGVAGGWRHTMAVDSEGTLYAWGWNKVWAATMPFDDVLLGLSEAAQRTLYVQLRLPHMVLGVCG